jgi:uncharacterized protein (TIGR02996 family)
VTPEEAFLYAIQAEPSDDGVRLVYADWLEEQGDGPRAEFIRVQIEVEQLTSSDPSRAAELQLRQAALLQRHSAAWQRGVRGVRGTWRYRRGFLTYLHIDLARYLESAEVLFRLGPAALLRFTRASSQIAALAESTALTRLSHIDMSFNFINDQALRTLLESSHLPRPRTLRLARNFLRNPSAEALAASPDLGEVEYLDVSGNVFSAAARQMLRERFRGRVRLD